MSNMRDFELYLLSMMRCDYLVDEALVSLQAARHDLKTANDIMTSLGVGTVPPAHGEFFHRMLGEPIVLEEEAAHWASEEYIPWRFRLSLWPSFDFLMSRHSSGMTYIEGFVRAYDQLAPIPKAVSDLSPWNFVDDDLKQVFHCLDDSDAWPPRKSLVYAIPETPGGVIRQYILDFDFNLLQRIKARSCFYGSVARNTFELLSCLSSFIIPFGNHYLETSQVPVQVASL